MFITHDLSVVKYISDRVGVMYLGTMVELAAADEIFHHPIHPYTEALLNAIPTTDTVGAKELSILEGDIPSPVNPPKGCKFHTRCKYCTEICTQVVPGSGKRFARTTSSPATTSLRRRSEPMLFQKRVDRAMRYQKERNEAAELKKSRQRRIRTPSAKRIFFAMILSAMLVILPVAILILFVIAFGCYFLFFH